MPKGDHEPSGSVPPIPPQWKDKRRSLEEVRSSSPGQPLASARAAQSLPPTSQNRQAKAGKRAPSAKV